MRDQLVRLLETITSELSILSHEEVSYEVAVLFTRLSLIQEQLLDMIENAS
jgi:hypothetical protein